MSHIVKPAKNTTFLKKVNRRSQRDGRSGGVNRGMSREIVIPIAVNGKLAKGINKDMRYLSSKLVNEKPLGKITGKNHFCPFKLVRTFNMGSYAYFLHRKKGQGLMYKVKYRISNFQIDEYRGKFSILLKKLNL